MAGRHHWGIGFVSVPTLFRDLDMAFLQDLISLRFCCAVSHGGHLCRDVSFNVCTS